ncbi:MAG: hypothetical protein IT169_12515 [Bryobacterales bacterium]|nr:hypothetical protein [Bryobacterales bacterium]
MSTGELPEPAGHTGDPARKLLRYPVPWDLIFGLTGHIQRGSQTDLDGFTRGVVSRMDPAPVHEGMEHLPADPRFLLIANHYQRKGLWILHTASAITQAIRGRYGAGDPPVRWVVTANWPRWKMGPWRFPSPGDLLLPRVAHALHCYSIPFAGKDPKRTARSLRRILNEAHRLERPIGLFPEGVAGSAGTLGPALPGVDRFLRQLARAGMPAVPCGVSEQGRFVIRFGHAVAPEELLEFRDAAGEMMARVRRLI